jgi:hypothetical protein
MDHSEPRALARKRLQVSVATGDPKVDNLRNCFMTPTTGMLTFLTMVARNETPLTPNMAN